MLSSRILPFVSATITVIIIISTELGMVYSAPGSVPRKGQNNQSNHDLSESDKVVLKTASAMAFSMFAILLASAIASERYRYLTMPPKIMVQKNFYSTESAAFVLTSVHFAILGGLILAMVIGISGCCLYLWHSQQLFNEKGKKDDQEVTDRGSRRCRRHFNPELSLSIIQPRNGRRLPNPERSISRTGDRSFNGFTNSEATSPRFAYNDRSVSQSRSGLN